MRNVLAMAALILVVSMTEPSGAQQQASSQQASSFFTGVNPRQIVNKPIDTSAATKAFNLTNSIRTPRMPSTFTLSSFFPKITLASWPPKIGSSANTQPKSPLLPINNPLTPSGH